MGMKGTKQAEKAALPLTAMIKVGKHVFNDHQIVEQVIFSII
jgi:hypothetical protein